MLQETSLESLQDFMAKFANEDGSGRIYLTGGASAFYQSFMKFGKRKPMTGPTGRSIVA